MKLEMVFALVLVLSTFASIPNAGAAEIPASGAAAELKADTFRLRFGDDGRPASLFTLPGGEEILNTRSPGQGFYLTGPQGKRTPLKLVSWSDDGRLTARSADKAQAVVFAVRPAPRYVALRVERLDGIPAERGIGLHFELNSDVRVRVTELDYMTTVQNERFGVRVHWEDLWHRTAGEPLGGVALYTRKDDADEDETLLHIWVEEKLPRPKVPGEWTVERARAWAADWQRLFADRSQMILEGDSVEELRAAIPWAEKARIKEIYLFTQTWRTDNFWPSDHGNIDVNRKVFPKGEEDLLAFSKFVRSKGMRLNLHYVSGGVGRTDPTYVGSKPDRRLASWARGNLAKEAAPSDRELLFQPLAGTAYPPDLPSFFEYNHLRVEDEIVRFGSVEKTDGGAWLLKGCERGQFLTKAAAHPAGADAAGLVVAYGQNYVPDNDSTMLDEIAAGYARLINHCEISHTEYDGAEINCYNGNWGYRKFATKVYEQLDHPVTAHDSSGRAPRCYFEYRLNSSERILAGRCPFTHGNWSAPVELASPSRVASTLLDANFVLSQGNLGGALGLCKPEPMFAVSDRSLKAHGLTDRLIETLLDWKAVSRLLTDDQRSKLNASFGRTTSRMPEHSLHVTARDVQVVRKTTGGYQIVPVTVMTRKDGDIRWQQGQEHGAVSPRQYVKPGEELMLENPWSAQPAQFIIRVLWAFNPQGPSTPMKEARGKPAASLHPSGLFTASNQGAQADRSKWASNMLLQPAVRDLRMPNSVALQTSVTAEGGGLRLDAQNSAGQDAWELRKLPEWSCGVDMTASRGICMRISGDGSGAILLFQIPGRDYVLPIDFTGTREIEIPNGEVAWADGHWGWRMDTKRTDYAQIPWCRLGFGFLPAGAKASVLVEGLKALGETSVMLQNPIIRTGAGALSVLGSITSGQYLQYEGGKTAAVYDENRMKIRDLPVEKQNYIMPTGTAPVSITSTGLRPWLEVQFMTEGEPMMVGEGHAGGK